MKEENKGKEVLHNLKGGQERIIHRKKREGEKQLKEKEMVISKGDQYHNPDAVTRTHWAQEYCQSRDKWDQD